MSGLMAKTFHLSALWKTITNTQTKLTPSTYTKNISLTTKHEGFDPLGDVLKPVGSAGANSSQGSTLASQPQIIPGAAQTQQAGKVLTGDLDSSLASLAENLTINKSASSSMK